MKTIEREWLKKARTEKGLTMKEVSRKLGISESYYCFIENGTRQKQMGVNLVVGISNALDIPATEVFRKEAEYAES